MPSRVPGSAACPTLRGFTLFEVVLATALAAVLVGLLGMALHVYLTTVSIGRGDVEQAQLARAILSHIAGDLRAAVRKTEQDVSALKSLGEQTGAFNMGSLDEEGNTGGSGGSGASGGSSGSGRSSASGSSGSDSGSTDLASEAIPPPEPGLYGNQYQLQVDISRIPRFDELDALLQVDTPPSGHASDLRTVAYFVQHGDYVDESSSAATELGATQQQPQTERSGLMRRELDRAAALYSFEFGGSNLLTEGASLLAPEVTWMEFQYFDGTQLWPDWDSTDRGGLPMAVEVRIWLRPPRPDDEMAEVAAPSPALQSGPGDFDEMYRMVVHLPAGEPTSVSDTTSTGGSTSGSSSTSGTGGSSSSGAGGGQR